MYIITDLVGPDLCIVNVIVLICKMVVDDVVDFLLHERTDVIENCLFFFSHVTIKQL